MEKGHISATLMEQHDKAAGSSTPSPTLLWKSVEDHINSMKNIIASALRDCESNERAIKERGCEVDAREKLVEELAKQLELNRMKFNEARLKEEEEFESNKRVIKVRGCEIDAREKRVEELAKELELNRMKFKEARLKEEEEFESNKRVIKERGCEVDAKEKRVEELAKEVELNRMKFKEARLKEEEEFNKRVRELELKENDFDLNKKQLEARLKEVELENKKLIQQIRDLEPKERKFDIDFSMYIDGKGLQISLNEHERDHAKMEEELLNIFRKSSDPAKLVLDAMEGFYPPHLKKGDMEFEEAIVKKSCILLLESLMKISPKIHHHVRNEAKKLAFNWGTNISNMEGRQCLDVLGFFYLLAAYELASEFDSDWLIRSSIIVAEDRQSTPEILHVLGLAEKIPAYIRNLVENKKHIEAIRFIYAFEMVDAFPPVLLLKDYLHYSEIFAGEIRSKESGKARVTATKRRIADLMDLLKCVEVHKLDSEISPEILKQQIKDLTPKPASSAPVLSTKPSSTTATNNAAIIVTASTSQTSVSINSPITATFLAPSTTSTATTLAPITVPSPSLAAASAATLTAVTSSAATAETQVQPNGGSYKRPHPQHHGVEHKHPREEAANKRPRITPSKVLGIRNIAPVPHQKVGFCMNEGTPCAKTLADVHKRKEEFAEGDLVMAYLSEDRFPTGTYKMLKQRKVGPCRVVKKIGPNICRLELPNDLSTSPVFNVSDLSPFHDDAGRFSLEPNDFAANPTSSNRETNAVLDTRIITTRHGTYTQYLVSFKAKHGYKQAWISEQELKKVDKALWQDLTMNSEAKAK